MRNEAGEDRASRRGPHFGARTSIHAGRSLPHGFADPLASGAPVASFDSSIAGSLRVQASFANRGRRPPRSVPRGPRERRAHPRSGASSIRSCHTHRTRARKGVLHREVLDSIRRSRDEDRRFSSSRSPFAAARALRLRAGRSQRSGSRSRALERRSGFRPGHRRLHASLSPRANCRLLQMRRGTGTVARCAGSSCSAPGRDVLPGVFSACSGPRPRLDDLSGVRARHRHRRNPLNHERRTRLEAGIADWSFGAKVRMRPFGEPSPLLTICPSHPFVMRPRREKRKGLPRFARASDHSSPSFPHAFCVRESE